MFVPYVLIPLISRQAFATSWQKSRLYFDLRWNNCCIIFRNMKATQEGFHLKILWTQ